ncbi:hypothetical protein HELRODRAFT_184852 [Helobdella robusta]|uniref:Nuclear transcription factor Y subunit gamma n=1 Tax=Helobdella robusta TaxID=6412 RepID=T1FM31_HELRO|nr:hypothetical protein HELRODRAFT_184852 [Helobdella robusta]ESO12882.1 hypothetical protein HELRODRAFT_184852 [Helobdella robusta]
MSAEQNGSAMTEAQEQLKNFWIKTMDDINNLKSNEFKTQELPLARIKKIMKMDEDVKMISAEAPVLFAKAAEIFINELTLRGWVHAEDNKRRTLQRNDIAMAITKYDQFDFLIDIVPREEIRPAKKEDALETNKMFYVVDQPAPTPQLQVQASQVIPQQIQLLQGSNGVILSQPVIDATHHQLQQQQQQQHPAQQIIQLQAAPQQAAQQTITQTQQQQQLQQQLQQQQLQQQQQQQQQTMQVFTQVVGPNGDVQQIPIQLTPSQLQQIALQMQGKQPGQQIVIHTAGTIDQSNSTNATTIDQSQQQQQQQQQFNTQTIYSQIPMYSQNSG